jgi:acylpyruvate hydrolase
LREGRRTNDSIRMKNFPGYTPLSRTIVPRDLVGNPHDLAVKAWIDGEMRQDARTNKILWTMQELVEYLSHVMPLRPGDLIMTGAPEELPFPPGATKGIRVGQTIDCWVENIGRLDNTIGEQTERQPNEPE